MAQRRRKVGEAEGLEMRRIGVRHAVVLAPRQTQMVDMNAARNQLERIDAQLAEMSRQRSALEARRADLSATLAQFDALPIDRDDDDPSAPLAMSEADPPG